MGHDHQDRQVSRRRLITGIGSLGLGGLLTAGDPRAAGTVADSSAAGTVTGSTTARSGDGPAARTGTGSGAGSATGTGSGAGSATGTGSGAGSATGTGSGAASGATSAVGPAAGSAGSAFDPDTHAKAQALLSKAQMCKLTPGTKQGPYYFETGSVRSDLREDRQGVRLRLALKVQDGATCRPLPGAAVEVWHCDASGLYSGAERQSRLVLTGGDKVRVRPGTVFTDMTPSDGRRYLRGVQLTDRDGIVRFTTIWPGWYPGRTVHVHVMVVVGDHRALCTEIMFDEKLNRKVLATPPYRAGHKRPRDTFNGNDPIFRDDMLAYVVEDGDGYLAAAVLATDHDERPV
jgi:protocatechuate 3,4-dioxygenase beta subunit